MVRYFAAELIRRIRPSALQAATLSGLNRNTVNRFYRGLRERILLDCEARRPLFGVVEVDESFFRGASGVGSRAGAGAAPTARPSSKVGLFGSAKTLSPKQDPK